MDYAITHEGRAYTPSGSTVEPAQVEEHNAALEAAELAYWATAPERWQGYVVELSCADCGEGGPRDADHGAGCKLTRARRLEFQTWTGKRLGSVTITGSYRNALTGTRMESIRVRGTNGAIYYGRYGSDWSQLCRVRKARS